jgi:predicted DCC family thiol-disulfide oxidoreductase YuxK
MNPLRDVERFFFAPQTGRVLGLYRILIGALTFYCFALWSRSAAYYFSDAGVLSYTSARIATARPMLTVLAWARSPLAVELLLVLLLVAAALFTIGLFTRASTIALFVLVTSFHERNAFAVNSGDILLRCILFFFLFAPAGAAFSVDALLRRLRTPDEPPAPTRIVPWTQRMMQIQVAVLYLTTAYAKSRGGLWHNGSAMYYVLGLVDFSHAGVERLMNHPVLYSALTFSTLFAELALPFVLWFRAARPYALALGVFLHGYIIFMMDIPVFGILLIVTYTAFFSEAELDEAVRRVRAWKVERATVFYDALCPICRRTRVLLGALDLFGRLDFVDANGAVESVPRERLLDEMHLRTDGGTWAAGFHAFRWMALRLPALAWLAPLLHLPGASFIGTRVYRRVARNRYARLRCDGACALTHAKAA